MDGDANAGEGTMLEERSRRYALAMRRSALARVLELLPMATASGSPRGALLDLMSGSGFASDLLGERFTTREAADICGASFAPENPVQAFFQCDAALLGRFAGENRFDRVVCLGGFHHLLPPGGIPDNQALLPDYRVSALVQWRQLLRPGGRLIIADVPALPAPAALPCPAPDHLQADYPALYRAISKLPLERLRSVPRWSPDPAQFLTEFVGHHSCTRHLAGFETAESIQSLLQAAGFRKTTVSQHTTPWVFPSRLEAAWFISNLFGIVGAGSAHPEKLPAAQFESIWTEVERYLGIRHLGEQQCAVGWALFCAVGQV
jgi:SAM-dependent methyltransferase